MPVTSSRQRIFILCCCCLVAVLAICFALLGLSLWYWISLAETSFDTTKTTFIGSSNVVVPLGCYSRSKVRSVTVRNVTAKTKIYTMEKSRLKLESSDRTLPGVTNILRLKDPYKFQLNNGQPLYTVEKAGYITHSFSILLNNSVYVPSNDCVLNITTFDNYMEYSSFLNTKDDVQAFNYTCLSVKSHEIEGVFVIKLAVPVQKFIYFAGMASGVKELNFTMIAGLMTYYRTENLVEVTQFDHCTKNDPHDCTVTIGKRYASTPIDTSFVCVLINRLDNDTSYEYLRTDPENKEDDFYYYAIGLGLASVCGFIVIAVIVLVQKKRKAKRIIVHHSIQAENDTVDEAVPLIHSETSLLSYRSKEQSNTTQSYMQEAMEVTGHSVKKKQYATAQHFDPKASEKSYEVTSNDESQLKRSISMGSTDGAETYTCISQAEAAPQTIHVGMQFNTVATLERDRIQNVTISQSKLFTVRGDQQHSFIWDGYGFELHVPKGACPPKKECDIIIDVAVGGDFVFPKGVELVSAIYIISMTSKLQEPSLLRLQHCVDLSNGCTQLCFYRALLNEPTPPYHFKPVKEKGDFDISSRYGELKLPVYCGMVIGTEQGYRRLGNDTTNTSGYYGNDDTDNISGFGSDVDYHSEVERDIMFNGQMLYLEMPDVLNHWQMKFVVTKDVDALKNYITSNLCNYEEDEEISFKFKDQERIRLDLNPEDEKEYRGWTVRRHRESSIEYKRVTSLGCSKTLTPSSCLFTVYGDVTVGGYVKVLSYPLLLNGAMTVDGQSSNPKLFIVRTMREDKKPSAADKASNVSSSNGKRTKEFHTFTKYQHDILEAMLNPLTLAVKLLPKQFISHDTHRELPYRNEVQQRHIIMESVSVKISQNSRNLYRFIRLLEDDALMKDVVSRMKEELPEGSFNANTTDKHQQQDSSSLPRASNANNVIDYKQLLAKHKDTLIKYIPSRSAFAQKVRKAELVAQASADQVISNQQDDDAMKDLLDEIIELVDIDGEEQLPVFCNHVLKELGSPILSKLASKILKEAGL